MYEQTRTDQTPWRDTGASAVNRLSELMGIKTSTPGWAKSYTQSDLLGDNLSANADLYARDAEYRKAYDEFAGEVPYITSNASRYDKYGPNWIAGFQSRIGLSGLNERMKALADAEVAKQGETQSADFGALTKKFTLDDYVQDPGYQFRLSEGMKGLDRSAAARGGLQSGAALKAAANYSQNAASAEYGNAYNRFNTDQNTQYNRLASLAGLGQTATSATAAAGSNYANNVGSYAMTNGANQGNAALSAGNARGSSYSGIANALGSYDWSKLASSGSSGSSSAPLASGWDAGYYGTYGNGG